jgi:hypothetical protein
MMADVRAYRSVSRRTFCNEPQSQIQLSAVADTGAQTCSIGSKLLGEVWPGSRKWLLKTAHRIYGVTKDGLKVAGAIILKLSHGGTTTTEIVYVCDNTDGFYLSETALKNLGLLNGEWPDRCVDSSSDSASSRQPADESDDVKSVSKNQANGAAKCGCPKRARCPPMPSEIPYKPTEENVKMLEEWILEFFEASAFNTCTHQPMEKMTGEALKITFKDEYTPYAVHCPIQVPYHWKEKVKEKIDADVRLGILEEVPAGVPTTWCSRMVTVPKKDGTPRRTVDLKKLNDATCRETHHTPPPFVQVNMIPRNKRKTLLDAWNGYHSVELSEEGKNATTFITEWGRYRYRRAPMGFHGSNDGYTKRFDDITVGFPRVTRCVDDSLLWDDSIGCSFWHTMEYIKLCSDNGIVFNRDKFKFARERLEFAGFDVTNEGYRPTERILSAIRDFPTPESITDIRSWYGLVHQVAYAFAQAPVMAPFRELLSKMTPFYWDENLSKIFMASKDRIISEVKNGVKTFETHKATCLFTDWSRTGIGFVLTQKQCECEGENPQCGNGHWNLIFAGSRFLKDAETRYAAIEGEAIALIYGLESCRMFIMGCPKFIVAVDHKPLVRIFNDKRLEDIKNLRLLKCREKAMMYSFKAIHIPGKSNLGADAASRYPVKPRLGESEPVICEESVIASVAAALEDREKPVMTWERIREEAAYDRESQSLVEVIINGFPPKERLDENLKAFWRMRDDLYVVDCVPFKDGKMLIPQLLRSSILEALHEGHQGINAMLANARKRFFWPGMAAQLRQLKSRCRRCREIAPSLPREPMVCPAPPTRPFQHVVSDIFDMAARLYVVYADRYSGWTEVAHCPKADAATIKKVMRKWFITFGVPEELSCDGGPQYESKELRDFLKEWGVDVRQSSAYYPQSNGRAEVAVKCVKRFLCTSVGPNGSLDHNKAARALLLQRNTPMHESELSPAEILFGQPIRDHLPRVENIKREWKEVGRARETEFTKRIIQNTARYDDSASRQLKPLPIGESVAVQDRVHGKKRWHQTGVVLESNPSIRQYLVRIDGSNRVTQRNRRHLQQIDEECANRSTIDDEAPPQRREVPREETVARSQASQPVAPNNCLEDQDISVASYPETDFLVEKAANSVDTNVPQLRRSVRARRPVTKLDL